MQHILIVGAGFGGLRTAVELDKKFHGKKDVQVTLVDRHDYQLFHPNLFEAATSEEEFVSQKQLKASITLPIREVLRNTSVNYVKGEVGAIDTVQKTIAVGRTTKPYDYLVMATGSVTDYFGIQGAEEYSLPLKNLTDALRIRNAVEFAVQQHRLDVNKKTIKIVIAGGGYSGVELAGEMHNLANILAWKYSYPREKLEVVVIEAAPKLIMGLDDRLSSDAYSRLKELGVDIKISTPITKVDNKFLEFISGERMEHDVLIWTTGVKGYGTQFIPEAPTDRKQRFQTTPYLQLANHPEIFAIGDCACVMCPDGRPMPPTAQDAGQHAMYVAYALPYFMKNQRPKEFKSESHGFIVNVGGKWAVLKAGGWYLTGWLAYVIDKFAHTRYYLNYMGLIQALNYTWNEVKVWSKND